MRRQLVQLLMLALLAPALLLTACRKDDDDKPPRQDGWVQYLHPDGWLYYGTNYILPDGNGGVWISHSYGISYFHMNGTPLDPSDDSWVRFDTSDGTCGAGKLAFDTQGGLWLHGSWICHLDFGGTPLDKTDDQWTDVYTQTNGLKEPPTSFTLDPSGGGWVGYIFSGMDYVDFAGTPSDPSDDAWVNFGPLDGMPDSIAQDITIEPGVGVWFGTILAGACLLDYGASPFNKGDDRWISHSVADGLDSSWVFSIGIDSNGRKWFGTFDDLSCLDDNGTSLFKGDDQWNTFPIKPGIRVWNSVEAVAFDSKGGGWFGTTDRGVYYLDDGGTPFDKSDDASYYSTKRNGLPDPGVHSITIDASDGVWVGTSGGLAYLPP